MSAILQPLQWFYHEFGVVSIHETGRNAYLIIIARSCRLFAYGTNALILAIFFSDLNFSDHMIGLFMTLTLLGDVLLGTWLTLIADRVGRRRVLLVGSFMMMFGGAVFAVFENFWILLLAAVVGVISVAGGDFGPFRSIEESVLSQLTTTSTRSDVLAWYVTTSTLGSSIGSEASGRTLAYLQDLEGWTDIDAYHVMFWVYSGMGVVNAVLVLCLSDECELKQSSEYDQVPQDEASDAQATTSSDIESTTPHAARSWLTKIKSWFATGTSQISTPTRSVMYKLWVLLMLDSLADGMVPYALTNYYLNDKFHPSTSALGDVTSISYFLGAICAVFAGPLARKIGLINTMVFTHVPSSAAVLVFPLPPYFWMTAGLLFVRAGLNNMDQAPRTAFIAAVVKPEERTAVMGITTMLRTLAATSGPTVTGFLAASDRFWIAFVAAGLCRLAYDFGLYALFVNMQIQEDEGRPEEDTAYTVEDVELQSLADSSESSQAEEDGYGHDHAQKASDQSSA